METIDMNEKMIFIIGSPRSGSTLLERMIGSHSKIMGGPEPHLITPLAHLGYYETVDKAPYDHLRAVDAQRSFVDRLPGGEEDYLEALRSYCNVLYSRLMTDSGKEFFLDKTPAYALVLPFLLKVYPGARYIVLTRHPGAVFSSFADSFFEGDWKAAHEFNPVIERYIPAIARFLREDVSFLVHVRYEDLVTDPEKHLRRICETVGLSFEPQMINYGQKQQEHKGLGDPFGVGQHKRPVTSSVDKWVQPVKIDPVKEKMLRKMIGLCNPEDLDKCGYPVGTIMDPLDETKEATAVDSKGAPKKKRKKNVNKFRIERWLLHRIRRNIHHNAIGKLVKKIRFSCDVLLR